MQPEMAPPPDAGEGMAFVVETGDADPSAAPVRKRTSKRRRAGIAILVVVIFLSGVIYDRMTVMGVEDPTEFSMIADAWGLLHNEYVAADDMDPADLAHGAISGMALGVRDTGHTYFLTPEEVANAADVAAGSYGGIGVGFDGDSISSLTDGAPAIKAGLHVGDRVLAVDGRSTLGADRELVLDTIRGEPGTRVLLKVEHPELTTTMVISITRGAVDSPTLEWAMVPGTTVGLVRLYAFNEGCGDDVASAIREAMHAGATGLVLDLRGNPGGLSEEAVAVASLFLKRSDVVVVERDADGIETTTKASRAPVAPDLPLVILVDGDSASASEIVMGALQDANRATVVGTTTAGTGTTMYGWPYDDGSELWIGTLLWFTPNGRSAWHVGLAPDINVGLPTGQTPIGLADMKRLGKAGMAGSSDAQLLRALKELASD